MGMRQRWAFTFSSNTFRKRRILLAVTVLLTPAELRADGPADNNPATVRQVPPPGIAVPQADRARLTTAVENLRGLVARLEALQNPRVTDLLPDVEIYARAVEQALDQNELFAEQDIAAASDLIAEGTARAEQLLAGDAPWTRQSGLVVRGFRSRLDDTVQPYGLLVPDSYDFDGHDQYRCDLWFHGRGEKMVELQFIQQRRTQRGTIAPAETIVLHPFGRYCNAFKFAGEVDVLEALDHALRNYRIDPDRIADRGFSMGGAAAWQFAVHYSDRFFAANPGAGFSETPEFLRVFQQEELHPEPWERTLWQWYDCPVYVTNLHHCPTIAYSGEIDRQKQAADVMEAACRDAAGMELLHVIGPQTAHSIHPDSLLEIEERLARLAQRGRERVPQSIRLRTPTLKYNRMCWVTINALAEHWRPSGIDAELVHDGGRLTIVVHPEGVTDFSLHFGPGELPSGLSEPPDLRITAPDVNFNPVGEPLIRTDLSWHCRVRLRGDDPDPTWEIIESIPIEQLVKRHNLQGPIDDAFMGSFLFVTPSSPCRNQAVDQWVKSEQQHAIAQWRQQMRGDVRVKADTELTDDDVARHNLVLWGDPAANSVLARILDQLPIQWTNDELIAAGTHYSADQHVPVMIYPNPLNPDRYVVLNSGFTYREYDYLNNARQTPKLPDWAVIDVSVPAGPRWPGRVVAANFFDEQWHWRAAP
jgi:acetyl esterase/lipase